MVKLRAKHKRFCQEYIKDSNGAQAAIRAGYSPKCAKETASEILTYPNVKAYLAKLMEKAEDLSIMTAAEILRELSLLGRTDIANYLEVDHGGTVKVKTFDAMPPGASRCIRKIKEKRTIKETPGNKPDMVLESTLEIELWSKENALEMLGRHRDLFKPKDAEDRPLTLNVTFGEAKKAVA